MSGVLGRVGSRSGVIGTTELDYEEGEWTPNPTNLTVVGSPNYSGTYTRVGDTVFCQAYINSSTTTASAEDSTYFTGLPFAVGAANVCAAVNGGVNSLGNGLVWTASGGQLKTPTWAAHANVWVSFWYTV
tara:strand:+ start:28 stop:417 length:390 start_codon:yes stop_codon:yes gene_type:complete